MAPVHFASAPTRDGALCEVSVLGSAIAIRDSGRHDQLRAGHSYGDVGVVRLGAARA